MWHQLESETLCDRAEADRKPGMKSKSTESNRSLATRREEAGLKRGEGKQRVDMAEGWWEK